MAADSVSETPKSSTESQQQRVRDVLLRTCTPKVHGQTAWELAGEILAAAQESK